MEELQTYVNTQMPRCLAEVAAVKTKPVALRDCPLIAFEIAQQGTQQNTAQILGYRLGDHHRTCEQPFASSFISPLFLRWPDGTENLIFDSGIHGYHGEMNSSVKYRGEGTPQTFSCPHCGHTRFHVVAQFDYWDACIDLWEDEPDLPIADYFLGIVITGRCLNCHTVTDVLAMDL